MSTIDKSIVSITDPTLRDSVLQMTTESFGEDGDVYDRNAVTTEDKASSEAGAIFPVIQLKTIKLSHQELAYFRLIEDSFVPRVNITIDDINNKFTSTDYPKDGDIISVYIRPKSSETFSEIRMDFDIINIKAFAVDGADTGDSYNTFTINGVAKIPGLYAESNTGYTNNTSFNHLLDITEKLGLGLASNETDTVDSMNRINPYNTEKKFIQDITSSVYKDDDSFFTSYIDRNYYLNLVNVNKQFSEEDEIPDGYVSSAAPANSEADDDGSLEDGMKIPMVVTNLEEFRSTNSYITKYAPFNNTGAVWMSNGYSRNCQYFDVESGEFNNFNIDPLTTKGSEDTKMLMKGAPNDDFYLTQKKYKYLGRQHNSNMHPNYKYAILQNAQNLHEIEKMYMDVELDGTNFNYYRYQRIPVLIYEKSTPSVMANKVRDDALGDASGLDNVDERDNEGFEGATKQYKNESLSGWYVISSIIYTYRKNDKIRQQMKLLRREWPIAAPSKDV